jgi:endogenous inhibitor of DNA gyrase (YacG/DUF329 family)
LGEWATEKYRVPSDDSTDTLATDQQ